MLFTNVAFGEVPIVHVTGSPSKQSITGDKYTFPSGRENSVISVSHFSLGRSDLKSRLIRFSTAGEISPLIRVVLRSARLLYCQIHFFHEAPYHLFRNKNLRFFKLRFDTPVTVCIPAFCKNFRYSVFLLSLFILSAPDCFTKIITTPR